MMHPATPRDLASTRTLSHPHTGPDVIDELTCRVQAEYIEMPGLSVTLPQAQRLWGVDRPTCEQVFAALVARGFLRVIARDRFIRA
jgi:hypothetical protein